jgi:hypothetical protein
VNNEYKALWIFRGGLLDGLSLGSLHPYIDEISIAYTTNSQRIEHVYTLASISGVEGAGEVDCFIHYETRCEPYKSSGLEDFNSISPAPPYP